MNASLFDYDLPGELVAKHPAPQRDASRLLVLHRESGGTAHRSFADIADYLKDGDVLVTNDTRVIRARLIGRKEGAGARVELFLVRRAAKLNHYSEDWDVLARPSKRLKKGQRVFFDGDLTADIIGPADDGMKRVRFGFKGSFDDVVERTGHVPLPPYIGRDDEPEDAERYQTVYAREPGSVAAPTAGLHFTEELLDGLRAKGVVVAPITLAVGPGTFLPVKTEEIEEHHMHSERYFIPEDSARAIDDAKSDGRRVVCVGTTSVRALESAALSGSGDTASVASGSGETDIFIYPGFTFRVCDALITNFHLPKSTLLMLVSAFAGRDRVLAAYAEAIASGYRFYSYGDAMLII